MGFSKFKKFYETSDNFSSNSIKKLENKIVIIDAYPQLHRMLIGYTGLFSKENKYSLCNINRNYIHVYVLFNFTCKLIMNKIIPFYVFDGGIPTAKLSCVKHRNTLKKKALQKLDMIEDKNSIEAIKQKKKCIKITSNMVRDCTILLQMMGIGYIVAPNESDEQLVAIYNYFSNPSAVITYESNGTLYNINTSNLVGGILSDDTDILAFGGKKLLKDFSLNNNITNEITPTDVLKILQKKSNTITNSLDLPNRKITFDDFLNFSILMGTNYNQYTNRLFLCTDVEYLFRLYIQTNADVRATAELIYAHNIKKRQNLTEINSTETNLIDNDVIDKFMENFNNSKLLYQTSEVYNPAHINILPKDFSQKSEELSNLILSLTTDTNTRFITNINKQIANVNFEIKSFLAKLSNTTISNTVSCC